MTSKYKRYCSVPQCTQYKDTNVPIHSFPADAKLRKVWQNVLQIGKPISKYMPVYSKHFVHTDYKCKWNPNAKVHFLRPDAIPSQNLPVTLHQNIEPVMARSFRKRRNLNESDQNKACANIEFPHHSDETDRKTDEVFMENASVEISVKAATSSSHGFVDAKREIRYSAAPKIRNKLMATHKFTEQPEIYAIKNKYNNKSSISKIVENIKSLEIVVIYTYKFKENP